MVSLRVASLFSGIGGLDQGLARAGHRIVLMCERDEHCKQVLAARFPGVPLLNDVAEVLPFMIEQCDLIAAGFPCNDCSHENLKRPGLEEGVATRNVAHVFRLLESVKVPVGATRERVRTVNVESAGEVSSSDRLRGERTREFGLSMGVSRRQFGLVWATASTPSSLHRRFAARRS